MGRAGNMGTANGLAYRTGIEGGEVTWGSVSPPFVKNITATVTSADGTPPPAYISDLARMAGSGGRALQQPEFNLCSVAEKGFPGFVVITW